MGSFLSPGTSNGTMACWDMRFQLPISSHSHPSKARIRRLLMHPVYQSWVIAGKRCLKLTSQLPEVVIKGASVSAFASSPGGKLDFFFFFLVVFLVLCLRRGKREGSFLFSATVLFLALFEIKKVGGGRAGIVLSHYENDRQPLWFSSSEYYSSHEGPSLCAVCHITF